MADRSRLAAKNEVRSEVVDKPIKCVKPVHFGSAPDEMNELECVDMHFASPHSYVAVLLGAFKQMPGLSRTERTTRPTFNLCKSREIHHAHPPIGAKLHRRQTTIVDERPHPLMVDSEFGGDFGDAE